MGTFKEWMLNQFNRDQLSDIIRSGVSAGFVGLTYFRETSNLYGEFHEDIWEMLGDDADDQGVTICELISSFGGAGNVYDDCTFKNLLVWYAAEKVAFDVTELDEQDEDQD